jgi:exosortase
MMRRSVRPLVFLVFVIALFVALTWPIWRWLWGEWMGNDYYSHGILIAPVALFLAVQRLRNDPTVPKPEPGGAGSLLFLAAALAIYLFFVGNRAYYLAAFAMVLLVAGLVWSLAGWGVLRKLLFPIGYLMLMVPLPFIDRVTLPLALFTGVCAGGLVRLFGLDVTIVGNAVTLPNAEMVIGAQCSGINSLIALTALMTLAAYLLDGPWWGRLTLIALTAPLAILGNICGPRLWCGGRLHLLSRLLRHLLLSGGDAAHVAPHPVVAHAQLSHGRNLNGDIAIALTPVR